jgi:hypothetical protein
VQTGGKVIIPASFRVCPDYRQQKNGEHISSPHSLGGSDFMVVFTNPVFQDIAKLCLLGTMLDSMKILFGKKQ